MNNELMFSSKSGDWETPRELFKLIDSVFCFDLDVCATEKNRMVPKYFNEQSDGLKQQWHGTCWMNPPYGRKVGRWVEKARAEVAEGHADCVVCLLPARTDTVWWHSHCIYGTILYIRGRLKFSGHKDGAPFPSAIVIFKKDMVTELRKALFGYLNITT